MELRRLVARVEVANEDFEALWAARTPVKE